MTHLVVLDSEAETRAIQSAIDMLAMPITVRFWIGGVQLRDQASIASGWLSFHGGPLIDSVWAPNEPSDADFTNETNAEKFVRMQRDLEHLVDAPGGSTNHGSICECDGIPVAPDARAAIESSRGL